MHVSVGYVDLKKNKYLVLKVIDKQLKNFNYLDLLIIVVIIWLLWNFCKLLFKGNPNSQGILNWILQTLHYYCGKQCKNIKNL